jgi:hypothetical protein
LSDHETARQDIDALQKPNGADQHEKDADDVQWQASPQAT